ncbi:RYamide receptor [Caerostris extrusa]|uniref:RYamide receptor n=1 Tax=Caerostris extrusa TaxID=172846 RepID=A0AAV4MC78_CAEEX|nr:RYamide receptor [Caerostris extrusa]
MENMTEIFTVLLLQDVENFTNGSVYHNMTYFNSTLVDAPTVPKAVEALMYIMYIVISVAAIGGNVIVCYIVFAYQRMRSVTNFFIVNLAVGDILMASLCIPFGFVSNLLLQYWPFGAVMCIVVSYAQAVLGVVRGSVDTFANRHHVQARTTSRLDRQKPNRPVHLHGSMGIQHPKISLQHGTHDLQYFFPLAVLIYTYTRIAIVVWGKRTPGEAQDARDQRMAASKEK